MSTKRENKAGWYEPGTRTVRRGLPEQVMKVFYRRLDQLCRELFEFDEDHDLPVHVDVIDRTVDQMVYFEPLPQMGIHPTRAQVKEAFRRASGNLQQVADQMRQVRIHQEWLDKDDATTPS